MKRLLLAVWLMVSTAAAASAQHQRLGLVPQSLSLGTSGAGGSATADAFCLDEHLWAPTQASPYRHVLSGESATVAVEGQPPMSLQAAIDQGLVEVSANGLKLQFVNKSGRPVTVRVSSPTALGESGQARVPDAVLQAIPGGSQVDIWKAGADERRLKQFSYLPLTPSPAQYHAGILRFQTEEGIAPTGTIDAVTSGRLLTRERETVARFARLGFSKSLDAAHTQTLSDVVRAFESNAGLPDTGILSGAVEQLLRADENRLRQIVTLKPTNHPDDLKRSTTIAPEVFTFQHLGPLTGALVKTADGVEFWTVEDGAVGWRAKGRNAILDFESMARLRASEATANSTLVIQPMPAYEARPADLSVDGEDLELASGALSRFIAGGSDVPELTEAITDIRESSGHPAKILVTRSPVLLGRRLTGPSGGSLLAELGFRYTAPEAIAKAIRNHYGDRVAVFVANDIERAVENATHLPAFHGGSDLRIYVDGKRIKDYGTIAHIRDDLGDARIEVLEAGDHGAGEPNVVLFAGHNSGDLRETVAELGRQGAFSNRIVALAVCGQGGEMEFNSRLIRDYHARAVLFYDVTINAQAVEDVLLRFSQLMMSEGASEGQFQALWERSVDDALKGATASEATEIRKLKRVLFQVASLLEPRGTHGTPVWAN